MGLDGLAGSHHWPINDNNEQENDEKEKEGKDELLGV